MIIIGITGSIGTGKSTIASMMRILKFAVHDSDLEVKKILENNELVKNKIKKKWPNVIFYKGNKQCKWHTQEREDNKEAQEAFPPDISLFLLYF